MKTSNNAADQPKRTLLTGFDSFDYTAQDDTPKYLDAYLYCHSIDKKHLSKGFLPRCQLLEQIYKDTTISDMFFPPTFPEPVQSKSHSEYKLAAIGQLMSYLNWWVQEKVERERPVFWFYAYSYIPCQRRVAFVNHILDDLITEFNFSHQTDIAEELKKLANNLTKKAIEWDERAHSSQQWQQWIDPSRLNPVEVKWAAAALLYKLQHIGSLLKEELTGVKADLASKKKDDKKTKSKGRGRPQKYNEKLLRKVYATFEQKYQQIGHKQQAWQETAEEHGLTSGKAAEIACRRYLKKQNKKQN